MGKLIAVDFHCKYQKVAWLDQATGEISEADLHHDDLETVRGFYQGFPAHSTVGMEVSGYSYWFEQMVHELGPDLKVVPVGEVARRRRRRQKNDRRDALLLLELLVSEDVPTVFRPLPEAREGRMLIRHLVRLKRERTRWINVVRALVYNYNVRVRRGYLSRAKREQIRQLEMSDRLQGLRDELLERIEQLERALGGPWRSWRECMKKGSLVRMRHLPSSAGSRKLSAIASRSWRTRARDWREVK